MNSTIDQLKSLFATSRTAQLLGGLLVIQLALAAGLQWQSRSAGTFAPPVQLVGIDTETLDRLVIDNGTDTVTLSRNDDSQWTMDDEHNSRADVNKINELIATLSNLSPGLPVANTEASQAQLEVSDEQYQRKLQLISRDESVEELLIGTSPGFRKAHIRNATSTDIYAGKINTFDIPPRAEDWLDRSLLAFSDISAINTDAFTLTRNGERWDVDISDAALQGKIVNEEELKTLLAALDGLRVTGFGDVLMEDEAASEDGSGSSTGSDTATDNDTGVSSDAVNGDASSDADTIPEHPFTRSSLTVTDNNTSVTVSLTRKGDEARVERDDIDGIFSLSISSYEALGFGSLDRLLRDQGDDSEGLDQEAVTLDDETASRTN